MMFQAFRPPFLGAAAILVAAQVAQGAGFSPGRQFWMARNRLNRPGGILALADDRFLILDQAIDEARMLIQLRIESGPGGLESQWKAICCGILPEDAVGVFGGAGGRFMLMHRNGDVSSSRVTGEGPEVEMAPLRKVFDAALREAAGVGTVTPYSCAAMADGSLVIGYDRKVLRVVPAAYPDGARADPDSKEEGASPDLAGAPGRAPFQWLLGEGLDTRAALSDPGAQGMIVAEDGAGRILAIDRRTLAVFRVDPRTLKKELVATAKVWPAMGTASFLPDDARAWGDTLFVAGFPQGCPTRVTVALELDPGAAQARALGIGMEPAGPFAVTPAGHLALVEPSAHAVRIVRNALAPGEPRLDQEALQAQMKEIAKALAGGPGQGNPEGKQAGPVRKAQKAGPMPKGPADPARIRADAAFRSLMATHADGRMAAPAPRPPRHTAVC